MINHVKDGNSLKMIFKKNTLSTQFTSSLSLQIVFKRKAGISFITLICFLFQSFLFPLFAALDYFKTIRVEQTDSFFVIRGLLGDDYLERCLTPQSPSSASESGDSSIGYSDSDLESPKTPSKTPRSCDFGVFDLSHFYRKETKHFSEVSENFFTVYESTEKGLIFEIFSHDVLILSLLAQKNGPIDLVYSELSDKTVLEVSSQKKILLEGDNRQGFAKEWKNLHLDTSRVDVSSNVILKNPVLSASSTLLNRTRANLSIIGKYSFGNVENAGKINALGEGQIKYFSNHENGVLKAYNPCTIKERLFNFGEVEFLSEARVLDGIDNYGVLLGKGSKFFLHGIFSNYWNDFTQISGRVDINGLHWVSGDFNLINSGNLRLSNISRNYGFKLTNSPTGECIIEGDYALRELINRANADQKGKVEIKDTGSFLSINNFGEIKAHQYLTTRKVCNHISATLETLSGYKSTEVQNNGTLLLSGEGKIASLDVKKDGIVVTNGPLTIDGGLTQHGKTKLNGETRISGQINNHGVLVSDGHMFYASHPQFINHDKARLELSDFHFVSGENYTFKNFGEAILGKLYNPFKLENVGTTNISGEYNLRQIINHGNEQYRANLSLKGSDIIGELINTGIFKTKDKTILEGEFKNNALGEMELTNVRWNKARDSKRLENYGKLFFNGFSDNMHPRYITNYAGAVLEIRHRQGHFDRNVFEDRSKDHSGIYDGVDFLGIVNFGMMMFYDGYYTLEDTNNHGTLSFGKHEENQSFFDIRSINNSGRIESPMKDFFLKHYGQNLRNLFLSGNLYLVFKRGLNGLDYLRDRNINAATVIAHADKFINDVDTYFNSMHAILYGDDFKNLKDLIFASLKLYSPKLLQDHLALLATREDMKLEISGKIDNKRGRIDIGRNGKIKADIIENGCRQEDGSYPAYHDGYKNRNHGQNPDRKKYKRNAAYIRSQGSLNVEAAEIHNDFGIIKALGQNVAEDAYSLLLKGHNFVRSTSGIIEATGKSRFEGNRLLVESLAPTAIEDIANPDPSKSDDHSLYKDAESSPRSFVSITGDLELAVHGGEIKGAFVGATGRIINIDGVEISTNNPTYFKLTPYVIKKNGMRDVFQSGMGSCIWCNPAMALRTL